MATLLVILCLGLLGTGMYTIYLARELDAERSRRYDAELWIDPIALEEVGTDED